MGKSGRSDREIRFTTCDLITEYVVVLPRTLEVMGVRFSVSTMFPEDLVEANWSGEPNPRSDSSLFGFFGGLFRLLTLVYQINRLGSQRYR